MSGAPILFFGRSAAMMALVEKQLTAAGWVAQGFLDEALLMAELDKGTARLLVIGGGVEDEARERLKAECLARNIRSIENSSGPTVLAENVAKVMG